MQIEPVVMKVACASTVRESIIAVENPVTVPFDMAELLTVPDTVGVTLISSITLLTPTVALPGMAVSTRRVTDRKYRRQLRSSSS